MSRDFLAQRRQAGLTLLALEQGLTEPGFQRLEATRHSGLADAELLRCGGQAARFGNGEADEIIRPVIHTNLYSEDDDIVNSIRRTSF